MPSDSLIEMVSKQSLAVLAVLAAVLAVAAGTAFAMDDGSTANTQNKTISVAGNGEIDAEPDAAIVRLSVGAEGSDAGSVSSQLAEDAEQLQSTLSEFGIADENVQTTRYYVREDHRTRDQPNQTRYMGEHSFEVTLDDVDRVGALIDAATDGGADDVGGVRYTLAEDSREEIRDEAIRNAIANARSEAAVVASATDLEITGVAAASTQQSQVRPYHAEAVEMAADGGTEIDPQDVTVTATVHVTFDARAS